jgi:hypothetical protein
MLMNKNIFLIILSSIIFLLIGVIYLLTISLLDLQSGLNTGKFKLEEEEALDEEIYDPDDCRLWALDSQRKFEECVNATRESFPDEFVAIVSQERVQQYCRLNNPSKVEVFTHCLTLIE